MGTVNTMKPVCLFMCFHGNEACSNQTINCIHSRDKIITKIYDMRYGEWYSQIDSQSFVLQMSLLMDCFQLMLVRVLPLYKAQWIGKFLTHSPLM